MHPLSIVNFLAGVIPVLALVSSPGDTATVPGWHLISTLHAPKDIPALSQAGVDVSKWLRIGPKATVMAGLLGAGFYNETDLFYSDHLRTQKATDKAAFESPWLYREEFAIESIPARNHIFLKTHGITSRADIYLNGAVVAPSTVQAGSYAGHVHEITKQLQQGGNNALLIKAYPTDYTRDLAISFLDWNQPPLDNGTGVWRDVELSQTGPVSISPPRVVTHLTDPAAKSVHITVKADMANHEGRDIWGTLHGAIEAEDGSQSFPFSQAFSLTDDEETTVAIPVDVTDPKIWWPATWGDQNLYTIQVEATVRPRDELSDTTELRHFGIRNVTSRFNAHNDTEFKINGYPFFVAGAGYTPDIFLRFDPDRIRNTFQYVLDIGLNTVRLEGKQEHPEFYDLADHMSIMVMPGWECCNKWDAWEYNEDADGQPWHHEDYAVAGASMRHEAQMMQTHPSLLAFLVGSDSWPNDRATKVYVEGLLDWPNPIIASASKRGYSQELNPSGMTMEGPYAWVQPNYWSVEEAAVGFGSELGPGVGTPERQSLEQFLPPHALKDLAAFSDRGFYDLAPSGSLFHNRTIYDNALFARYGKESIASTGDYIRKAQMMDYEATHAEFEGFSILQGASRPATGMIYWMLNAAWPSLHWQLFDYCLRPAGAYFGAKVGARLEHVAFHYQERRVYLINRSGVEKGGAVPGRVIGASLVDLQGAPLFQQEVKVDNLPRSSVRLFEVAGMDKIQDVQLLRLLLQDSATGEVLSRNVYWLSPHDDVMDLEGSNWYYTPVAKYADYRALSRMSPTSIRGQLNALPAGVLGQTRVKVDLENQTNIPAFFLRLVILDRETQEVVPVYWSDNYITLMPLEKVELTVGFEGPLTQRVMQLSGGNIAPITLTS